MTKITIEIRTENEAFEEASQIEVARILRDLANRFQVGRDCSETPLHDINGNTCGFVRVEG